MRWLAVLILGFLAGATHPVSAYNPFELRNKLSDEERQRIIYQERNPFELIRGAEAEAILGFFPATAASKGRTHLIEDQRYIATPGLMFWVYLSLLLLMSVMLNLERGLLGLMLRAVVNEQLSKGLSVKRSPSHALYLRLWYGFFVANAGIFLYHVLNYYTNGRIPGEDLSYKVWLSLGVLGFFLLQHLLVWLTGRIFPLEKPARHYNFCIQLMNNLAGFLLFPVNIAVSYTGGGLHDWLIIAGLCILGAAYTLRLLRGLWIGLPYLLGQPVHFFIYLCAVELAPIVLLVKGFVRGL